MANRFCNLNGPTPISQDYPNISIGFDRVAAELDGLDTLDPADRTKLDSVQNGAEVNQNAFAKVNNLDAGAESDTLTVEGGTGITVTTNPVSKKVIITATGASTPGAHGSSHTEHGADPVPNATVTEGGLMSAADKVELTELADDIVNMPYNVYRQAIINGNFDIWQRGTSFASDGYTADRWQSLNFADGGTLPSITRSRQQLPLGVLDGASYYYSISLNGAGSSLGANRYGMLMQGIEFGARYLCGNGKKVTVSFEARSSIAGKRIGVTLSQNYGTGGSPSSPDNLVGTNFTLTSSFQKYSFTFDTATLAGKTLGTNNNDALYLYLYYAWGSVRRSFVGATTDETFGGAGTIEIAEVQVNAGDTALPFQPKSKGQEEVDCLRYRWQSWTDAFLSPSVGSISGLALTTNALLVNSRFPTPMRIVPTMTVTNNNVINQFRSTSTGAVITVTPTSYAAISNKGFLLLSVSGTPFTVGQYYDFDLIADAEL
ncbi:hypothetical protein SAMN04487969_101137 [Paenibacillus algorifonticola]|uniref:Uncharacterized protein n=1 Tax=Paenibacillus algorifonticola TaxID=684063 RepID=A0A1I1Y1H0_9BACL|nr:hypothetical protein [Paenibacillus algorifonticola]SFE11610.1 hypothetical protein SAMN04487969_101137 [Paenibacillus algorifonticola]